jgi:hypothetical protein
MALAFPQKKLGKYAVRLTCYSVILAAITLVDSPHQKLTKLVGGVGMGVSSTVALAALDKNRGNAAVAQLETKMRYGLAADKLTAFETVEAERIRENLTVELKNSQSRVAEWE